MKYSRGDVLVQDWRNIAGSGAGTTTHTVRGLANGTAYTFAVRAVSAAGRGSAASVSATPVPAAPGGLTATARDGLVRLAWADPMDTSITGYQYRYSPEGMPYSFWANRGVGTSQTIGGLTNGIKHTFELRATAGAVHGNASVVKATPRPPPAAPDGLTSWPGEATVVLTWENPGNAGITGYEVRYEVSTSALPETWDAIEGSDGNTTSHEITGLTNGTRYTLEVRAVNAAEPGTASRVTARVGALLSPANVTVSAGDGSLRLSWDGPGYPGIGSYEVRYEESTSALPETWDAIEGSDGNTTSHEITGLTNGTRYTLEVRAENAAGAGAAARLTAAPGVPRVPEDLVWSQGQGSVGLAWTDPDNAAITGYQIRYRDGDEWNPDWTAIPSSDATTTSHTVTGLTNVTSYTFEVRAVSAAGPGAPAGVMPMTPKAPGMLRASPGVNEVTLTWSDPRDPSIRGYEFHSYSGSAPTQPAWTEIPDSGAGTTEHTVAGLTNGTTYTFEVRAAAGAVYGDSSVATDTPVPGAPAGLTGLSRDGSVVLSWEESGDAAIDRYQVRHAESGAALPGWRERHYVAGAGTTDHRVTELTNGTTYTFEVRARAGAVHGAAAEVTAMPLSCPALAVDGLNDTTVTLGQALSMTAAVSGVQGNRYSLTVDPAQGSSLTIDEQSGAVTGTATAVGTYAVTVTATDDRACTWSHTFTVQVCPVITVAAIEDVSVTAGGNVSRTARATGGCGAITYAMTGAPEGVRIETVTENGQSVGRISGAPGGPAREYEVTVTATDAEENTGDETFTITVQCGEITLTTPGTVGVTVGSTRAFTARAAGGQPGYTFTKTSGPSWVTVTEGGNVSAREAPAPQRTYPVGVSIEDVHGCTGTGSFTVAVCTQMVFEAINAVTVTAGSSVSRRAVANGGCGEKTYERSDGPGWVTVENDGSITVAPPAGTATGTYTAKVRATSDYGITAEKSFRIEVRDPRPTCSPITVSINPSPVKVVAGQSATATASARGGCGTKRFRKKVNSGTATWVTVAEDGGITVSPPAGTAAGNYTATVTATDQQDNRGTGLIHVIVTCPTISVSAGSDVSVAVGDDITRTVTATGGGSHTFSLTIAPSTGLSLSIGETNGSITGSASKAGTYTVRVSARARGASDNCPAGTGSFTVTVDCPTITVNAGNNMTVVAKESIIRTVTATGGGTSHTFSLSIDPSSGLDLSIGETNGSITGSASKAGAYTVTVNAKAANAPSCPSGSDDFIVTVDCPDISVGGLSDVTVMKGSEIPSMTATASGGQSPYTFRRKSGPSWVTVSSSGAIGGTATGDPGEYDVTVEATDDCGCTGTKTFKITVECPT